VSFASAADGVNAQLPPDPHPKEDAASVVLTHRPEAFITSTWYCVAFADEVQVKLGKPVVAVPLGAICVGAVGTGEPLVVVPLDPLTVSVIGPATPAP